MVVLRLFQSPTDEFNLRFRCLDALFGFLLKCMEDVDGTGEFHSVDRSKRVAVVVRYDLKHPRTAEPFEYLCVPVRAA
jgi:hypothetical protein